MTGIRNISIIVITAAIIYGCRKPYVPAVTTNYTNILVVEGIINIGGIDSTVIKLSKTGKVSDSTINPETGAVITIENRQGAILKLSEAFSGIYVSPPAALDNTKQYRLRIKTSKGSVYLSDFVDAKVSPPIDSVGYSFIRNGIQIYANTHDPTNNTRYYKYTYRETWQFTAKYPSNYFVNDVTIPNPANIVARSPASQVFYCFGSDTSSRTIVNSTAALVQDVAYQVPIIDIDSSSEKLEIKYSILIKQQALTKEAFAFYQSLQKNTENLGSIFDAQPSQLIGNIHNAANPTEPVIGYMTAGNTPAKRIFITKSQLPASFLTVYPYACGVDTVSFDCSPGGKHPINICDQFFAVPPAKNPPEQPLSPYINPSGDGGYFGSTNICTECTLRGHTEQPAFWK